MSARPQDPRNSTSPAQPIGPTTALIVVDMQNDFADPSGSLFVRGGEVLAPFINDRVRDITAAGGWVFYTQDWHPPETPHFSTSGGVWPVHCVRDTWGAALVRDLRIEGPVVVKGTDGQDGYSGFSMRDPLSGDDEATPLHHLLTEQGVTRVVVVGLALDVCVKATALDALALGYQVEVPAAGTAPVEMLPGDGYRAIAELVTAGVTIT